MMKLVLTLVFLIILSPLISESFSYFDGDMISHNLENTNYDINESKSKIIQFNESLYEQQVKEKPKNASTRTTMCRNRVEKL